MALAGCHGMDDRVDRAEVITVILTGQAVELDPAEEVEVAVQAQNADGDGVDDVRVFFLLSDTSVVTFTGRAETDLLLDQTKEQEAAGVRATGLAKTKIAAAADAGGKRAKMLVGLVSPSDIAPESGVGSIEIAVNTPESTGGAGGAP